MHGAGDRPVVVWAAVARYNDNVLVSVLFALLVTATPSAPPSPAAPTRVLVMDVEGVGVSADDAAAATRVIALAAGEVTGFEVMSTADLRRMLDLELERMNTGCTEESCLTEFADAMGAELVVFATLSKLGEQTTATLSLYSSSTQTVRRRAIEHAQLASLGQDLRTQTIALLKDRDPASPAPLIVGASLVGVGAATFAVGAAMLQSPTAENKDVWQAVGIGGLVGAGVGVVVAVVGLVMLAVE